VMESRAYMSLGIAIGISLGLLLGRRRVMRGRRPCLNKETCICISLSARPSNLGTRFHNYLYEEMGLDYLYKAFSTSDINGAIGGMRALGFRGCSVSMPFKEEVLSLVDELDQSAAAIQSVNTIVNLDGNRLRAYNTDYGAVAELIMAHALDCGAPVLIRGSGGMAKAVGAAFRDAGFRTGTVVARNAASGRALAAELGYEWNPELDAVAPAAIIVNVTPIGMSGSLDAEALAFPDSLISKAKTVFDVVAFPSETPLIRRAREHGKTVITGAEVIALQAAKQYELYTGIRPTKDQILRASAYSRAAQK